MFRKILIPVDFSSCSLQAYQYVTSLFTEHEPDLHLFYTHSTRDKNKPNLPNEVFDRLFEEEEFDLLMAETLKKTLGDYLNKKKIKYSWERSEQKASHRILAKASEIGADLIAMGTHGGGSWKKKIFGSTVSNTLHNSEIPVLAIPENARLHGIVDNILFGCDFQHFPYRWMERIEKFSESYKARLVCLDINIAHNPLLDETIKNLGDQYPDPRISFELIEGNDVVEGLINYADDNKMDIIVTHTHKMGLVERIIQHSYTDQLIKMSTTPVLALIGSKG